MTIPSRRFRQGACKTTVRCSMLAFLVCLVSPQLAGLPGQASGSIVVRIPSDDPLLATYYVSDVVDGKPRSLCRLGRDPLFHPAKYKREASVVLSAGTHLIRVEVKSKLSFRDVDGKSYTLKNNKATVEGQVLVVEGLITPVDIEFAVRAAGRRFILVSGEPQQKLPATSAPVKK